MTLTRANGSDWAFNDELTFAQINHIDSQLPFAIDGNAGGTYAPSGLISIGGSGLRVTTALSVTGVGSVNLYSGAIVVDATSLTVGNVSVDFGALSTVLFENGFTSAGTVDFQSGLGVSAGDVVVNPGNVIITAGNLTVAAGDVLFNGALSAAGPVTLGATFVDTLSAQAGAILLNGSGITSSLPVAFSGTAALTGATTFGPAGSVSLQNIITPSGVGRVRKRLAVNLPDANATIAIGDGDVFLVPALGATRTYTVSTTGAAEGDEIFVSAVANTTANTGNVGAFATLKYQAASTYAVRLLFTGGAWTPIEFGELN